MFDTIKLKAKFITIDPMILDQLQAKSITFLEKSTGQLITKYTIKDALLPSITYYEFSQTLTIQVSIPKFLYGNNVTLLKESDIPLFFQRLHERLYELFHIQLHTQNWKDTERIDVCWNFPRQDTISSYIKELSGIQLPFTKPSTHGHSETAIHSNKSKRICFYNKQQECIDHKEPQSIIDQAKGLLRMEIKPSYVVMRKYSAQRRAIDLLTKDFFEYITNQVLTKISLPTHIEGLTLEWFQSQSHSIGQIESMLGFQVLQTYLNESELKQIYRPSTFANKKKLAKQIQFPSDLSLEPLTIDYSHIS
ncbi:hypothetical protein GK047_01440 [Paenibacillus sp. SYP-B3998]|uniref:Replication-associated protein G2P N-terminal domain-containing protein n=1 Tax=Paenibacillus sp. SYP-B3998 TaxID=2678564 RepID=A0A6G3ZR49_9BACL|nr:phage/plasmid replication protein [Paenibacillus sp. SYP-B3998]NEW04683.1 hypothetical protein [Paenibacillus sp. SYP-B3998]